MSSHPHSPDELAVLGQPPRERADAARNRARLLDAAAELVDQHGAGHVTMEAVATAACVGKGTLFRRFGDRTGLMNALIDHAEQEYQQAFLTGPPPLGPDGDPLERLEAFGIATIRFHFRYLDVLLAAEPCASKRCLVAPRMLRVAHVTMLLRRIGGGGDADLLAQTLVAHLDPVLLYHLNKQLGVSTERIEHGWRDLVQRVTGRQLPHAAP
ncbi:TetR/AcrR family transcriptional regulator [Streptomyces sp. 8L]|uniref:TetR/AcrR family transcriptional regulator n=1 Tax=Streptomyces sp. 8L TaxID=2877242 RepID=UPI001CD208B7|nr:TetR/AcrR family transcriptional regulator [Streptomyces sp. 8L]MCA1223693.1 TetR/AcrR family transcriptional regulator [Streptomyces sp. 8L]